MIGKFFTSKAQREAEAKMLELEERKLALKEKMLKLSQDSENTVAPEQLEYKVPWIPKGVVPDGKTAPIAQDSCNGIYDFSDGGDVNFYPTFLGYPHLAMLSQSSDYRSVAETTATEMTRKWGNFVDTDTTTDKDQEQVRSEKIAAIEMEFKHHDIRSLIREAIEVEMSTGRVQIYIDLDHTDDSLPFVTSPIGVKKGALRGFKLVEPMWSTPSIYNAHDPREQDFFIPERWYVMGNDVHSDRLITLVMRPVPDILKPAYNFGGMSMYQLMMPYVQRYQRTVDSVAEVVHAFSLTILATDMSAVLAGENDPSIMARAKLFNKHRDNTGLMLLSKDDEEINQINTPLNGLHEIVQMTQEQMAAPSHTPLVKLLGVTPKGLNATAEGEIEVYRDYISAQNEAHIRPIIERISEIIQLHLFGEIDNNIVWRFAPLERMDEEEIANIQDTKMRTYDAGIQAGIISQEEAREALARNQSGDFTGIVVGDVPEGLDDMDFGVTDFLGGKSQAPVKRDRHGRFMPKDDNMRPAASEV